ncbi:NADH-quinone oxidoreductase subunit C, partial [Bacillus pseudomycoides]|uniref:NADH-quinone oxidoreductase subunit C n=1 Tax=Bacillus pseudomycoides TaxID=64104 RepID=UPI001643C887
VWEGGKWGEGEVYDLVGVVFEGDANLRGILMGDDWGGYGVGKDYEGLDVEV